MHAERTPNPNSVKWVMDRPVVGNGRFARFDLGATAADSPLAASLLEITGVTSVLLGDEFVSVNKDTEVAWSELASPIDSALRSWAESDASAFGDAYVEPVVGASDDVEKQIQAILETEVAPYVASDGGEVELVGYRDGIVEVVLRGACESCPSSTITLKMGIEARLKAAIPEIRSVIAV
jgi:Fe-S cluster biogenesis protein NfuA